MKRLFYTTLIAALLTFTGFGAAVAGNPLLDQAGTAPQEQAQPANQEQAPTPADEAAPGDQAAPSTDGEHAPVMIPVPPELKDKLLEAMKAFEQAHSDEGPSPEVLESNYRQVWKLVSDHFRDREKLEHWDQWLHKYDGKLTTTEEYESALQEMLGSLKDQWTSYTSTADMKKQQELAEQGIIPVGLRLELQNDGSYKVNAVFWGTAAYKSVLHKGDSVISVGGEPLAGKTAEEVENLLRGPAGKAVDIEYSRGGNVQKVTIIIDAPKPPQVEGGLLPGNIAYVRLPAFFPEPVVGMTQGLMKMHQQANGNLAGLILDLRGNPGGRVDLAQDVAEMFLEKGTIFSYTTREGRQVTNQKVDVIAPMAHELNGVPPEIVTMITDFYKVPMVVLVDGSSASAAEILTGALKDNGRAIIVGTTTWGKGVGMMQTQIPPGGTLSITSLDYLTPSGYNLNGKGIAPNVEVERTPGSRIDEQLDAAVQIIKTVNPNQLTPPSRAEGPQKGIDFDSTLAASFAVSLILLVVVLWSVHQHIQMRRRKEKEEAERAPEKPRRY
ncbi:MAG: PDZ domain-containing protein [Candidatus Melainabacteria bacterium]|nr:PDZ domain-containing protein [Candidatus Melainabacteria bacterium]